jgi:hypothetical protein
MNTPENNITPTTKNPTFTAVCDYFGSIERGIYAQTFSEKANCCVDTFALSYEEAVTELMKWIKENAWCIKENPTCKFYIEMNTGAVDKFDEVYAEKVFIISAYRAVLTGLVTLDK